MLGISTVWQSGKIKNGEELLRKIYKLGIGALELEYRIDEETYKQMKPFLKNGKLKILSVHNFFPVSDILETGSGDAFLLSSPEEDERKKAVEYTIRTIEHANDLEARAVVLHLGNTGMDSYKREFFEFYDDGEINSERFLKFLDEIKSERNKAKARFFDAVLFSLEKLNKTAEKENVMLGIENRYYFHQIPDFEEMEMIFRKFNGSNICYWHDVGHAETWQNLGLKKHEDWLKGYGEKLLGIHLHDCEGYRDHKAPGNGKVDFEMIKKYLKPETIKIIEVEPEVTDESLKEGIVYLKNVGIE